MQDEILMLASGRTNVITGEHGKDVPVFRKWRWLLVSVSIIAITVAIIAIKQVLPAGLGGVRQVVPFLFFSQEVARYPSPDGRDVIIVYVNDAGASHSGWFPAWIVQARWHGDRVVAKGYLRDSQGPVPLVWTGPRTFMIEFMKGRHDNSAFSELVELN